jgi:thymidylate synthase
MIIEGDTVGEIYLMLIDELLTAPCASPRGQQTRELLGVQLRLHDALANVLVNSVRNPNYRFMVTEWLWTLTGSDHVEPLARVNKKMLDYSDDGKHLSGSYGPRWHAQIGSALRRLYEDPNTRRAVISFWRHDYDSKVDSKDVPCTLTMQLILRDQKLSAVVNMRSSDAWLGIPYDVFNFTMLLNYAASQLEVGVGKLVLNLGSSHLYQVNFSEALQMLSPDQPVSTLRSAPLTSLTGFQFIGIADAVERGRLFDLLHEPWSAYLDAALCVTRARAFEILKEVHEQQQNVNR